MDSIYMFTGIPRPFEDFIWVSRRRFQKEFDLQKAIGHLRSIQNRIVGETGAKPTDFFSGLRHVFAELDGLGKLYAGEEGTADSAAHAVAYGHRYLGKVNRLYRSVFGLMFDLYRHGLMHTGMIRSVRATDDRGRPFFLKWALDPDDSSRHLSMELVRPGSKHLLSTYSVRWWLSLPRFREDGGGPHRSDHFQAPELCARDSGLSV